MFIRHPMKDLDITMLDFCESAGLHAHILLNKADKLSRGAAAKTLLQVKAALAERGGSVSVQLFSALSKTGIEHLDKVLNEIYDYKK